MLLPDVNVLIYAHRHDSPNHLDYARWLTDLANGPEPFALSVIAMAGVVRITTNPRAFEPASTFDEVFGFFEKLTRRSNARVVGPGPNHFEIFEHLCRQGNALGKLSADAQHAAVAIENGCTFVTTDSDFARFPGLRWRHPLKDT